MKRTMKFLLLITIIYGVIVLTRAAEMRGNYADPRYPGKCLVREEILSPGEYPYSSCGRMWCRASGWVIFQTCGAILPPEGYKLGEPVNPTAPYPKCCEKHFIPIDNEN